MRVKDVNDGSVCGLLAATCVTISFHNQADGQRPFAASDMIIDTTS